MTKSSTAFDRLPLHGDLIAELRSDHAGEVGAVAIYRGILAVSRRPAVRRFACMHLRAEHEHREFFERFLPAQHQSRLLPLWRAAGWLLGAGAALFGARSVFLTIEAVERFVEKHYLAQIAAMEQIPELDGLRATLTEFCNEEVAHRNDARDRLETTAGRLGQAWSTLVNGGSALGVMVARWI